MADSAVPRYTITNQVKSSEPDGQGGFHDVWRVYYQSASGTRGYVDLPAEYYSAYNVHVAVNDEVERVEAVNALDGTTTPQA